jgi:hypothetical protein
MMKPATAITCGYETASGRLLPDFGDDDSKPSPNGAIFGAVISNPYH